MNDCKHYRQVWRTGVGEGLNLPCATCQHQSAWLVIFDETRRRNVRFRRVSFGVSLRNCATSAPGTMPMLHAWECGQIEFLSRRDADAVPLG